MKLPFQLSFLSLFQGLLAPAAQPGEKTRTQPAVVPDTVTRSSDPIPAPGRTRRARRLSDALLRVTWTRLRTEYFPERDDLDDYQIAWSTRPQKRTLASCSLRRRKVTVARELNYPDFHQWLDPLVYHEMCHAALGLPKRTGRERTQWHGREFKLLERRHPEIPALDLWIKKGGWATAIRSDRAKRAHHARKSVLSRKIRRA